MNPGGKWDYRGIKKRKEWDYRVIKKSLRRRIRPHTIALSIFFVSFFPFACEIHVYRCSTEKSPAQDEQTRVAMTSWGTLAAAIVIAVVAVVITMCRRRNQTSCK